jgi:hypothetical protein
MVRRGSAHRNVTLSWKGPIYDGTRAVFPRCNSSGPYAVMRRPHRRVHRLIWTALPAIVLLLTAAALMVRPPAGDYRAMAGKEDHR